MTEVHPVQTEYRHGEKAHISTLVTKRAYEVYCHVYGPQEALMTGTCRGGFSVRELFGFLYARSFPKEEWRQRINEAWDGMRGM